MLPILKDVLTVQVKTKNDNTKTEKTKEAINGPRALCGAPAGMRQLAGQFAHWFALVRRCRQTFATLRALVDA